VHPRSLLALLVTLPLLAGCLGDDGPATDAADAIRPRDALTEAVHAIGQHLDHTFVGAEGVQLYVDYVLPEPLPEGGAAVILVFTPYQDADQELPVGGEGGAGVLEDAPYNQGLVDTFVPYGYAVAFADVRGNHNAGGCVDQTGPGQWQDGYDYVEWLGTQSWSNGNVGMFGISYDGETQFTTAMLAPPHLKTIVPMASVSNQYEWNFYQGVPYETQPTLGMVGYFQGSAVPSTDPQNAALYQDKLDCQDEMIAAGLDYSGDWTLVWKERDYRPHAGNITASVLHVHGLADWNVRPIHIDPLFNDIQSEKRAVFGQWAHQYPLRDDWQDILHAWYDEFLFERNTGILDRLPPVLVQDNQEQWRGIGSFPLLDAQWLELELSADGTLVPAGQAQAGELEIVDYPEEPPVAGQGGLVSIPADLQGGAPVGLDAPDRLEFTFVTDRDLHVVGRPEVRFTATTDERSTHWVAHLNVDGAECLGTTVICENSGYQDTRHRHGVDKPQDLTPGEAYDLTIRMYPQYDVIPAGSTVRLVLTGNDAEVQQDLTFARSLVQVGGGRAVLRLPLGDGGVALPDDELPDPFPQ
jgi:X-Pro dipeptidyl-peptidase